VPPQIKRFAIAEFRLNGIQFQSLTCAFSTISARLVLGLADEHARGKIAIMIISVTVPEAVIRAAQDRNMPIEEFVDMLIDEGMDKATGRPIVSSAIERIRALRTGIIDPVR
jgi:heme O synthase-like polyprenyltransferase